MGTRWRSMGSKAGGHSSGREVGCSCSVGKVQVEMPTAGRGWLIHAAAIRGEEILLELRGLGWEGRTGSIARARAEAHCSEALGGGLEVWGLKGLLVRSQELQGHGQRTRGLGGMECWPRSLPFCICPTEGRMDWCVGAS